MIEGKGKLFHCSDRRGNDAIEIDTTPGNVVFMRAPGFPGCTVEKGRPFHFVNEISKERFVFCLRQIKCKRFDKILEFDWKNKKEMEMALNCESHSSQFFTIP